MKKYRESISFQFAIALVLIFFSGCTLKGPKYVDDSLIGYLPPLLDGNKKFPDYCVALSGGGIRSGSVSLGVLQGLYGHKMLSKAEYLTSVSGGGYPVYGILSQATVNSASIEELLKENSSYIGKVQDKSKFISSSSKIFGVVESTIHWLVMQLPWTTEKVSLSDLFKGQVSRKYFVSHSALSLAYGSEIHDTFSGGVPISKRVRLKEIVIPEGFPYPIFVASNSKGQNAIANNKSYKSIQLFEMSRDWIGSDEVGYWRSYIDKLSLRDAIISSGAAIDTPEVPGVQSRVLPGWVKKLGVSLGVSFFLPDEREIYVADGGFIENQGVLPLVRRGCKEIVALDATADTELKMQEWENLKLKAEEFGWVLDVPKPRVSSHVPPESRKKGWELDGHILVGAFFHKDTPDIKHKIYILKLGYSPTEEYDVKITEFAEKNWNSEEWNKSTFCNDKSGLGRSCAFPLESTGDQSYSLEEFEAYRLLGRHMVDAYIAAKTQLNYNSESIAE